MSAARQVLRYELRDVLRGRWLVAYALFFLLVTEVLLRFGGGGAGAIPSLVTVLLLVVPLVSLVVGAMHLYGARAFTELLLAQPVRRGQLFLGLYLGLVLPLCGAYLVGTGLPFLFHGLAGADPGALALLAGAGAALTAVFAGLAFLVATRVQERVHGLGILLGAWLLLAVVYDGLVLAAVAALDTWPVERLALALVLLNPVDLARVTLLLGTDAAAMMGYTGAVFARFFGGVGGGVISAAALALWVAVPFAVALRSFQRRDF